MRSRAAGGLSARLLNLLPGGGRSSSPSIAPACRRRPALLLSPLAHAGLGLAGRLRSSPGLSCAPCPRRSLGVVPWLLVRRAAAKRMRRFEEQLPEGARPADPRTARRPRLASGFQMVGDELDDPIGTEFGLVAEEIRLGLELRDALENLVKRVGQSTTCRSSPRRS